MTGSAGGSPEGPPTGAAATALRVGMTAAAGALRAMGPVRYPLADLGGLAAWAVDGRRRAASTANHLRLGAPSAAEASRRSRASFRQYARTSVDFLWAMGMSADQVRAGSRIVGTRHVDAAVAAGRGGILALSHFGNWDFAALVAWSYGLRLTTVMAPVGNSAVTQLVIWARERNALEVFTPDRAARGLIRALARGRFVALLCDIAAGGPVTTVRFCGGPVLMSLTPAWLAMRSGAALLPVDCRRGGRGEPPYVITAHSPLVPADGEDPAALTQRLATALEAPVRRHPEQWYPFGAVYADR